MSTCEPSNFPGLQFKHIYLGNGSKSFSSPFSLEQGWQSIGWYLSNYNFFVGNILLPNL